MMEHYMSTTKLIRDPLNGYRWQWRYLETRKGYAVCNWFDLGPSFDNKTAADNWYADNYSHRGTPVSK
jgi:hypothetical protein